MIVVLVALESIVSIIHVLDVPVMATALRNALLLVVLSVEKVLKVVLAGFISAHVVKVPVEQAIEHAFEHTENASKRPVNKQKRVRKDEPSEFEDHCACEFQRVETKVSAESKAKVQFLKRVQLIKVDMLNVHFEHVAVLDLNWYTD